MNAKAIVLGGATGLLGQALVRVLQQREWTVTTLGRGDTDIADETCLFSTLDDTDAQVIFNTIAWTQVDLAEDDPSGAMQWNRAFPAQLARYAKANNRHLIHYSTDFVFSGGTPDTTAAYTEKDTPHPACIYGQSKLEGEQAVLDVAPEHSCILRTAWLFGPGRKNFVSTILEMCHKKDGIEVVHDQVGSPTYTLDLALWSALVAEQRCTGIYHAVNSGRGSWCDLACEAVSLAGAPCRISPITSEQWPQKALRPGYSVLNTDKLAATINMNPRPWPVALRDYLFNEYLEP